MADRAEFALCSHCVLLIRRLPGGQWEHYDQYDPIAAQPIAGSELPDDVPLGTLREMAHEAREVSARERRFRAVYTANMEAFAQAMRVPLDLPLRPSGERPLRFPESPRSEAKRRRPTPLGRFFTRRSNSSP